MIIEQLFAVDWGITVRHEQDCDGQVTIQPAPAIGGTLHPGQIPPATIAAKCAKCGPLRISHFAIYAFDAELDTIADLVQRIARSELYDLPKGDQERFDKAIARLRERSALNTDYQHQ